MRLTDERRAAVEAWLASYRRPSDPLRLMYPAMYRTAVVLGAEPADIDAACALAACRAWAEWRPGRGMAPGSLAVLHMRGAVDAAIKAASRRRRTRDVPPAEAPDPADVVAREDTVLAVRAAVGRLGPDGQFAVGAMLAGRDIASAARAAGLPAPRVQVWARKAAAALRSVLHTEMAAG